MTSYTRIEPEYKKLNFSSYFCFRDATAQLGPSPHPHSRVLKFLVYIQLDSQADTR
jgi:hypothetical protein